MTIATLPAERRQMAKYAWMLAAAEQIRRETPVAKGCGVENRTQAAGEL